MNIINDAERCLRQISDAKFAAIVPEHGGFNFKRRKVRFEKPRTLRDVAGETGCGARREIRHG